MPKRAAFPLDRGTVLLVAALLACATLPYLNILFNGFVHDDDFQLVLNPYVRSFHYLKKIFTANVWSFQGPTISNYYRPMMTLGYLLGYKIFGMQPCGFHLVSLLLHALVVCLIFALTKRLTGDRGWAFVAGAWFALHPIHSESVAWIAAVTDLELTFFYLITFGLFVVLAKPGGRTSPRLLAAMGATFVLALLSKEPAMTLPPLATVYEHFYREDRSETSISQKLARYGVLWLIGAIYLLLRVHYLGALAPEKMKFGQVPAMQIFFSAIALVGQYVWKLVWPVQLWAFYVFHPSTSPLDLRVLAGLAVLLALAALFLVCWRSRDRNVRFASFAILWFVATLAPVLNAHWLGVNVFTERYLYLPSVGVAWLVGLGATKLWSRAGARPAERWALALVGVTVGMLYAARIVIRDRDWNNDIVLYTRSLEPKPQSYLLLNLGLALANLGRFDEAVTEYSEALRIEPDYPEGHNNLGTALARQGRFNEAMAQYSEALRLKPGNAEVYNNLGAALAAQGKIDKAIAQYAEALRLKPDYPEAHLNLGGALAAQGKIDKAIAQYAEAIRINPDFPQAHLDLGVALAGQGRIDEAIAQYSEALRVKPDLPQAHFDLGAALASQGRMDEAIAQYAEALRLKPDFPDAHLNMGAALASQGRIDEAIAHYSEALRLKPDYPGAHNDLGLALANKGRIDAAIAQYAEALRLEPDFPEAHLNLGLALADQGRIDAAAAQYSEALRLRPNYSQARSLLNDLMSRAKSSSPHSP